MHCPNCAVLKAKDYFSTSGGSLSDLQPQLVYAAFMALIDVVLLHVSCCSDAFQAHFGMQAVRFALN